jgi:hypothetical protein
MSAGFAILIAKVDVKVGCVMFGEYLETWSKVETRRFRAFDFI